MTSQRRRGDRATRMTHYGNLIEEVAMTSTKSTRGKGKWAKTAPTKYPTYTSTTAKPKYAPVSDEVTVYGAKKFRTPATKNEFTGRRGSLIPAYVFDIDGTLTSYGSSADKTALAWAKKIYDDDPYAVFLVITARDHGGFGYTSSFNWLMHNFPYPFIGPFARATDDPRYASEFKRELAQGFEDMGLYQIMGAADDNKFVINMWKQWAIDHFEDPKEFDLLECASASYVGWRSDLPSKGSAYGYGSYGTSYGYDNHKDEHWDTVTKAWVSDFRANEVWVKSAWNPTEKKWVEGHWELKESRQGSDGASLADDPAWKAYFDKRESAGAYTGVDHSPDSDLLDEVLGEIELADYGSMRADLEDMVSYLDRDLTPAQLAAMSINTLREKAGVIGDDSEEYREALIHEINRLFGEWRYTLGELNMCTLDELEQILDMSTEEADRLIDNLAKYLDDEPTLDVEVEHVASKKRRMDVEDDVWAAYSDLTMTQIQNMDIVVLEDLMDRANNAAKGQVLTYHDTGVPTAPLDVAEVLAAASDDEEEAWRLGGRSFLAQGGELVEIGHEDRPVIDAHLPEAELQQQHPRYENREGVA